MPRSQAGSKRGRIAALVLAVTATAFLAASAPAAPPARAARAEPQAAPNTADHWLAVLKSKAPLEQKYEACRRLAGIGDRRAVGTLAGLLADKDLSHMARYALEPIPDASVDRALRAALGERKGDLLLGVIQSVGRRRDAGAVDALQAKLADADPAVVAAAALALGKIASPPAAAALADFRKTAPAAHRAAAAEGSLVLAQRLARAGDAKDAAAIHEELRAEPWPRHVRLGAFAGLLATAGDEAPALIAQAVAGRDPVLRAVAIARIPTLKGTGVVARFAAELPKLPPDVQVLLIGALADLGDPALRPVLTAAVTHANPAVRIAAIKALGAVGDVSSTALLAVVLSAGETEAERQAAAASLRALGAEGTDRALVVCMQSDKTPPAARAEMINILVDRKAASATKEILAEASSKDPAVRAAAIRAAGKLGTPKDTPAVLALLAGATDDAARRDIERALVAICRKASPPAAMSDPILAALPKADVPTRCSLLAVLGALGEAKALPAVAAAAKDTDAAGQDAALRALADWPDAAPLDTLRHLLATTKNPVHRVLALRGCVRLLGLGDRSASQTLKVYADLAKVATRPDDKKLLLAGLAGVADPLALAAVEPYLAEPATRAEAELALLKIARAVLGASPSAAQSAARKLQKTAKDPAVRRQAGAMLRQAQRFEGYVTAWQVAGPYEAAGKAGADLIDIAFDPEKPAGKKIAWKPLPTKPRSKTPWLFELDAVFGGTNRAAYVRTWVHADQATPAVVEFGDDDGSKLWVAGKLLHADGAGGACTPGEHNIKVQLAKGWTPILLKITQWTGPWQFCLRLRSAGGDEIPGLRYRPSPPEE